jgi:hypothetical protein
MLSECALSSKILPVLGGRTDSAMSPAWQMLCLSGRRTMTLRRRACAEALARQYAPQAMEAHVKIAMTGKSDSARVAAAIGSTNDLLWQRDQLSYSRISF